MEKFHQAETEEAQRQILERFAQGLPVTNRTVKGGIMFLYLYIYYIHTHIYTHIQNIFSSNTFL